MSRQTAPTTPRQLAAELGVHPDTVRQWPRRAGHEPRQGRWVLDPQAAQCVREHFEAQAEARRQAVGLPRTCVVEGCDRPRVVRAGLCSLHWKRWKRTGSVERHDGAEHQRAKTHCPKGHKYTPENTYVFADGRRRCRRCRTQGARQRRRAVQAH